MKDRDRDFDLDANRHRGEGGTTPALGLVINAIVHALSVLI